MVWRWQQRFAEEGTDGLLRDKTRKPGKSPGLMNDITHVGLDVHKATVCVAVAESRPSRTPR